MTSATTPSEKSAGWRAVLGEYPTGVCLITARDAGRAPVGMIVGSFVAVSEDPLLVGFFADRRSTTLPHLLAAGRFTVSVLSAADRDLARAFAQKAPDRWSVHEFCGAGTEPPRVKDAVVWIDASIESTTDHGDHVLVVGRVRDLGTGAGAAEMPLLFRRAGYGTFAAPSESYDARAFIERLRWATAAEADLAALADEIDCEITANTQLGDAVVTLASVLPHATGGSYENVGASHPWAAPIASVFAAWAPPARRHAWEEASRHLTGGVDRELIARQLSGIRARGYAIAGNRDLTQRFVQLTRGTGVARESYAQMWAAIAESRRRLETDAGVDWRNVAVVQVPVFGAEDQVVLSLYAVGLAPAPDEAAFTRVVTRIQQTARRMSERISGGPESSPAAEGIGLWGDSWEA
ncbi:flavin reductase [Microbacterium sp.]|uniref:flavin reductase n=1 Tax=Microbacterium sp. TaxID=51671 RepID=UPI003A8A8A02